MKSVGESKTTTLSLTPRQVGRLVNRVTATADGNLSAKAEHPVVVQKAQLSIDKNGPGKRYVGRPAEWNIRVINPGEVPLANVVVRDQLPPELTRGDQTGDERADQGVDAYPFTGRAGDQREHNKYQHCVERKLSFVDALRPGLEDAAEMRLNHADTNTDSATSPPSLD